MILLFHYAALLIRRVIVDRRQRKAQDEFKKIQQCLRDINTNHSYAQLNAEQDLRFDPPVYRQRYCTIHDVLLQAPWRKEVKKIVEFGCAEFGLFVFIKNLIGLTEIDFVDIDEQLLMDNRYKVKPLLIEHLRKRSNPLVINVFAGSITQPDRRILDADVVIGIELIEHLYPDVLEAVPYAVFHCIQPKVVIFTTPNADFNQLLPHLNGFRHSDHKFEWTIEQFTSWAMNITDRFPLYYASFHGIGHGPKGTQSLGCCSQMVVFVRKDIVDRSYIIPPPRCYCDEYGKSQNESLIKEKWNRCPSCCPMHSYGICTYFSSIEHTENVNTEPREREDCDNLFYYKLLESANFPFEIDSRTPDQILLDNIKYKIYSEGNTNGLYFHAQMWRSEIPLSCLTRTAEGQFISTQELSTLLSHHGYKLEECLLNDEDDEKTLCVIYEPEMENLSTSEFEASGYESGHSRYLNEASLSDWDYDDTQNDREGQKASPDGGLFPGWLLQMLRNSFPVEDELTPEGPDYYCQGDGLGVHPSVLTVDVDNEDEDASSESSSSTNATIGGTANNSSGQDIVSLPDDGTTVTPGGSGGQTINIISLREINSSLGNFQLLNAESEEYFDAVDELITHYY